MRFNFSSFLFIGMAVMLLATSIMASAQEQQGVVEGGDEAEMQHRHAEGDPADRCYSNECQSDSDCGPDRICRSIIGGTKCTSPGAIY